ncbi:MAG: hypothetical protein ACRDRG_00450 [Pseudonocardiaceae bacterium]
MIRSATTLASRPVGRGVVAVDTGSVAKKGGGSLEFVFCDVFTFIGDAISLETYQVNLTQ